MMILRRCIQHFFFARAFVCLFMFMWKCIWIGSSKIHMGPMRPAGLLKFMETIKSNKYIYPDLWDQTWMPLFFTAFWLCCMLAILLNFCHKKNCISIRLFVSIWFYSQSYRVKLWKIRNKLDSSYVCIHGDSLYFWFISSSYIRWSL